MTFTPNDSSASAKKPVTSESSAAAPNPVASNPSAKLPSPGTPAAGKIDLAESLQPEAEKKGLEVATLAGGCFWGMEELILKLPGVLKTQVGYTGGTTPHATYEIVKQGKSGHAETVDILFDPKKTTYEAILLEYFRMHDPTTKDQQGNDRGSSYRSAIFTHSEAQAKTATAVKARVDKSGKWGKAAVTEIVPATAFWKAEEDHQKYLAKNPGGYTCHFIRKFKFD